MAAAAATVSFQAHNGESNNNGINRREIQAAITKAVELRALHAALMQGNSQSPANSRYFSSASPAAAASRPVSQFSAQDYPVFTPSYDDEPSHGYQIPAKHRALSGSWDEFGLEGGNGSEISQSDYKIENLASRKGLESHICPSETRKSPTFSSTNQITLLQTSPKEAYKASRSRRNSLGDINSVSSCNRCKPAVITLESGNVLKIAKSSNIVVPMTDSHSSVQQPQQKSRKVMSWLFPKLKKKHKSENSPNPTECEDVSQFYKDLGNVSIETLKRELIEANENRDAALMEVSEMKYSLGELKEKLEYLESYCEELRKALKQATTQEKESHFHEKLGAFPRRGKSIDEKGENLMPVSEEVMVEGFLQIVSEARLSVKQFCKSLIAQIDETDNVLTENLNQLLQPYKLSLTSKYSKAVFYHLEAIINQSLYQDFENSVFQKNGSPKILDPLQDRQAQFSSFVALRNLSWNEVLRKGTKYYSEEFSKFCDQKMSLIITTMNWTRPWPEQLLQSFFVAAKCIWLLHLLAFSFSPPLGILRVDENRSFDSHFMEDMLVDRQRMQGPSRVKVMVMPGFYVQDRVLRCKVLCRYKSVA